MGREHVKTKLVSVCWPPPLTEKPVLREGPKPPEVAVDAHTTTASYSVEVVGRWAGPEGGLFGGWLAGLVWFGLAELERNG